MPPGKAFLREASSSPFPNGNEEHVMRHFEMHHHSSNHDGSQASDSSANTGGDGTASTAPSNSSATDAGAGGWSGNWGEARGWHSHWHSGEGSNSTSVVEVNQSSQTYAAEPGQTVFAVDGSAQQDIVTGFTVGQDVLSFHHIDPAKITLSPNTADPNSTDVIYDSGATDGHTLLTLQGVTATSLSSLEHYSSAASAASAASSGASSVADSAPTPTSGATTTTGASVDVAPSGGQDLTASSSEHFVFSSLTGSGTQISGYTPGSNELDFQGDAATQFSTVSLAPDPDNVSTDVTVDAGQADAHTLVTLADVLPSALHIGNDFIS
jgi:hypothetical protein